jgi:cytosine/adenosine deaminase-related metal-dependent hydrolase
VLSGRIPFESISARDIASVAVYRSGGADIRRTVVAGTRVH